VKFLRLAVALVMLGCFGCWGAEKEPAKAAQSIDELQKQLETILKDTQTPGVSVAIVHREGPEWVTALGKADVAAGRAATSDTLFRIGSVSKAFASLSILKLADEGKLSLTDPVRKLAPEVWFDNRWESTDPIRVVHLLEHTTGWDDMSLREYAKDGLNMNLRDAFDVAHTSRVSRWRPGTRMSYCNSGPAVAAYIVEKISGQRFEDFVQQNLFGPIGMKTATYFKPAAESTTVLYHNDGTTPYPYWNIIYRPAGSINASAKDMAAYVQFYLNRGKANGVQVVPAADIDRMEVPTSSWAAHEGLKAGYGLSNYWHVADGFVYHGHNGGVAGGLTVMVYSPEFDAGYFYSINSGSTDAYERVDKAIRRYVTRKLEKPKLPATVGLPANAEEFTGWYEPASPRNEIGRFVERLLGVGYLHYRDGKLMTNSLGGWNDTYLPIGGELFRHVPKDPKDAPSPIASMILLSPNPDGRFLQDGTDVMRQIPAWFAMSEVALTAFVVLAIVAVLIYAPFWMLGGLRKKRRRPAERGMRLWPLVAVLSLVACAAIFSADDDPIATLGNVTMWSIGLCAATAVFAIASVAGAISLWRAPGEGVRRSVRWFSMMVTAALLIATAYFAYWGVIGIRTWS
jgi:CubicO group peptidase (beta-lactamase class C family)